MSLHFPQILQPSYQQGSQRNASLDKYHLPNQYLIHPSPNFDSYGGLSPVKPSAKFIPNYMKQNDYYPDTFSPSRLQTNPEWVSQPNQWPGHRNSIRGAGQFTLIAPRQIPLSQNNFEENYQKRQLIAPPRFFQEDPRYPVGPAPKIKISDLNLPSHQGERLLFPQIESPSHKKKIHYSSAKNLDTFDSEIESALEKHQKRQTQALEKIVASMKVHKPEKIEKFDHSSENIIIKIPPINRRSLMSIPNEPNTDRHQRRPARSSTHLLSEPDQRRKANSNNKNKNKKLIDSSLMEIDESSSNSSESELDSKPKNILPSEVKQPQKLPTTISVSSPLQKIDLSKKGLDPVTNTGDLSPMKRAFMRASTFQGGSQQTADTSPVKIPEGQGEPKRPVNRLLSNLTLKKMPGPTSEPAVEIKSPKQPEKPKMNVKGRISVLLWLALSLKLSYNDKKKAVYQKKNKIESELNTKMATIFISGRDFITRTAGKEIQAMLSNKQYNSIFVSVKVLPDKKLEKECSVLLEQFKKIVDTLTNGLQGLPKDVFSLLTEFSQNDAFLPSNFFMEFEINRLQFGSLGTLKQMDPNKSKFILGTIFFVRIFLRLVIMQPWDAFSTDKDKFNLEKIFNVGSVLYHVAMELFKNVVQPIQSPQRVISNDLKIQPKKKPLTPFADVTMGNNFVVRKDTNSKDGDIISGFYSKQQLNCFFSDRKQTVQGLKDSLLNLLDALYNKIHSSSKK